jgi:hypothetical protein
MTRQFSLTFKDREYTVVEGAPPARAAEGGGAPVGPRWYVALGPKAITSLDAIPDETDAALRERICRWLAEHPEMPATPDIVFGGG